MAGEKTFHNGKWYTESQINRMGAKQDAAKRREKRMRQKAGTFNYSSGEYEWPKRKQRKKNLI